MLLDIIKKLTDKIGFQDQLSLNAGQRYCRMLQGELRRHATEPISCWSKAYQARSLSHLEKRLLVHCLNWAYN